MSAAVVGKNQNSGGWTRKEDDVLFALYETHGAGPVSRATGRSRNAVSSRAQFYGLRCDRKAAFRNRLRKEQANQQQATTGVTP